MRKFMRGAAIFVLWFVGFRAAVSIPAIFYATYMWVNQHPEIPLNEVQISIMLSSILENFLTLAACIVAALWVHGIRIFRRRLKPAQ